MSFNLCPPSRTFFCSSLYRLSGLPHQGEEPGFGLHPGTEKEVTPLPTELRPGSSNVSLPGASLGAVGSLKGVGSAFQLDSGMGGGSKAAGLPCAPVEVSPLSQGLFDAKFSPAMG